MDLLHVPLLVEEVEEDALLLLVVHRAPGPLRGSTSAACTGEALRRRKGGRYLSAKRGRGGRAKADKSPARRPGLIKLMRGGSRYVCDVNGRRATVVTLPPFHHPDSPFSQPTQTVEEN